MSLNSKSCPFINNEVDEALFIEDAERHYKSLLAFYEQEGKSLYKLIEYCAESYACQRASSREKELVLFGMFKR